MYIDDMYRDDVHIYTFILRYVWLWSYLCMNAYVYKSMFTNWYDGYLDIQIWKPIYAINLCLSRCVSMYVHIYEYSDDGSELCSTLAALSFWSSGLSDGRLGCGLRVAAVPLLFSTGFSESEKKMKTYLENWSIPLKRVSVCLP